MKIVQDMLTKFLLNIEIVFDFAPGIADDAGGHRVVQDFAAQSRVGDDRHLFATMDDTELTGVRGGVSGRRFAYNRE